MKLQNLLILPFLVASLKAASVDDLTFTLINDGTEYRVTDCNESATDSLDIPSVYDDLPVTSIGYRAFANSGLNSITIPNSVTSIGSEAFNECINLTSAIFEGDAPTFGTEIFTGSSVTVNYYSYNTGWSSTFAGNLAVDINPMTFTLINNNTEYSVSDCLTSASGSLEIPSTYNDLPVTSVGNSAFQDCTSLTSITIPDSVTSIGQYAFLSCSNLTSITIPNSVTSIGRQAFQYSGLTSITTVSYTHLTLPTKRIV